MKLQDTFLNREYIIEKIKIDDINKRMLKRMNIDRGSVIKVIYNNKYYPFLIEIDGNRIAFEYEIARNIEVIPYV